MDAWLRVCRGRVAGTLPIVVLGFGLGGCPAAEPVHEPAAIVPVDPGAGDLLEVREVASVPFRNGDPSQMHSVL
jgi:hypothetical protein